MEDNSERLTLLLSRFDDDWAASDEARTEAENDLFFSRISQWDDWLNDSCRIRYRGQFDVVKPVVRRLVAEMRKNPVSVKYRPTDGKDPNAADILMGMFRTDMRHNSARIAVNIGVREQIEAGIGAWRIVTRYEDNNPTSNNQIIRRAPIHGAVSHVVWDANSREMDKSDAMHCTIITPMTKSGWERFAKENGLEPDEIPAFSRPRNWSWNFQWISNSLVYVGEHYEVERKKETVFIYQHPMTGELVHYYKSDIEKVIDDLANEGYEKVGERKVERQRVYKTLLSGAAILKDREKIAGENIPVIPVYGDWGYYDDREIFEGIVRGTKDAQRLRNMIMSLNADVIGEGRNKKPIFYPEQIAGLEHMFEGSDDYDYLLVNRKNETGDEFPLGPIGYLEAAEIPQTNQWMLETVTNAVNAMSELGVDPEDIKGGNIAFDTVNQLNMRADLNTYVFQDNLAIAMRRDGEIYASIAADLYDTPRKVVITGEDDSEQEVELLNRIMDYRTGQEVVLNDIRGRYDCYTDAGPSFQSMKEQYRAEFKELLGTIPPGTELWQLIMLMYLHLMDGTGVEMMRDYSTKQLVIMGVRKPETQEEQQWLMEAQQASQSQQDPQAMLAQAQMMLAQAENTKAESSRIAAVTKAQNDTMQTQINAVKVQTESEIARARVIELLARAESLNESDVRDALRLFAELSNQQHKNNLDEASLMLKGQAQQHSQSLAERRELSTSAATSGEAPESF